MPGFDGTGPRGRGPFSGRGRGYCVARLADGGSPVMSGYAGLTGRPFTMGPDAAAEEEDLMTNGYGEEVSKMPRGDGTGPLGAGPLTGRGAGYCAGFGLPGFLNAFPGRFWGRPRWGMRMGGGRGLGFWGRSWRGFGRRW